MKILQGKSFINIKLDFLTGLPHTQGTQGILWNSGNFQVEENLRETQGISGSFDLFLKLRETQRSFDFF